LLKKLNEREKLLIEKEEALLEAQRRLSKRETVLVETLKKVEELERKLDAAKRTIEDLSGRPSQTYLTLNRQFYNLFRLLKSIFLNLSNKCETNYLRRLI